MLRRPAALMRRAPPARPTCTHPRGRPPNSAQLDQTRSDEWTASRPQDQHGELRPVCPECLPEAVEDLLFAGQYEAGSAVGYAGRADLVRDGGPLQPELDQRGVDLVDPRPQLRYMAVPGPLGLCLRRLRRLRRGVGGRVVQDGAAHVVLLGVVFFHGSASMEPGARKCPGL